MNADRRRFLTMTGVALPSLAVGLTSTLAQEANPKDPLPSWNPGPTKKAILDFVARTTREGSRDHVAVPDRVAVFDNDGTLWCEQPMYVQLAFALDRVKTLADRHPAWKDKEPFRSVLAGNLKGVIAAGEKGLVELILATHAGMTTDEFAEIVKRWLATARHPRFGRPYTECVYQPMLEVMTFLRASGYRTYIVSGGGVEMIRVFAQQVYGVPPEQVIGSTIKTKFEMRGTTPVLVRLPEMEFIDDRAGKPVAIHKFLGRRPVMAFGNSDGDFEMLEWTTAGSGPRFGFLLHHTDRVREYAYDRKSPFGRLDRGLDEARKRGWIVADMQADFQRVFAFGK
ncbi:MAG: HAD family hydrolase [Gemmataceae bacterium]